MPLSGKPAGRRGPRDLPRKRNRPGPPPPSKGGGRRAGIAVTRSQGGKRGTPTPRAAAAALAAGGQLESKYRARMPTVEASWKPSYGDR